MDIIKVKTPSGEVANCPKADEWFFEAKEGFEVLATAPKSKGKPKRKSKNIKA